MKRHAPARSSRGFTLIELVIVIAVIAILAALLVPTILNQVEKARASRAASEVNTIGKSFSRMKTDVGSGSITTAATCFTLTNLSLATVPAANACGAAVTAVCSPNKTDGGACWGGPYMAANVANDPWTKAYIVSIDPTNNSIRITSSGPDATLGNSDDISKVF